MPFKNPSLKRKLVGIIFLTSLSVLLLTCAMLFYYEIHSYRQTTARDLSTTADIIAANSAAILIFDDKNLAGQILSGLRADPEITAAAFFDKNGKLFARYPADSPASALPDSPGPDGIRFQTAQLTLCKPVIQGQSRVGTLFLQENLNLFRHLKVYGFVLFLILVGSGIVALFLSNFFQRQISEPLLNLAEVAKTVSRQKDYSVRASKTSDDELGNLTEAFNSMLNQIQTGHSALFKSEEQLRIVADLASVYLCQFDREHRYKFANRAYAERYGFEPPQMIGRRISDVLGTAAYEAIRPYIDEAFTGKKAEFEVEIMYATLGARWIHVIFMPEQNLEGRVVGVVAVINDISLRKGEEQELKRARDEALNASRAKDDFLAALSHELRTPLNPVLLVASDAASNPQLPQETRADFDMIRRNVELEARLIDDLLDLTRITRGKLSLDRRLLDVRGVLQEAIATVRMDAEIKQITLASDLRAGQHMVFGDGVRLQQVFWNVLKNAVKFTPEGGKITVKTFEKDGALCIEIIDTGIGMNSEELDRVFDAFSQGDHAEGGSHRFGGLGLGLAISRMLVELHSGSIHAASEGRGQGSTFLIQLPLAPTVRKNGGLPSAKNPAQTLPSTPSAKAGAGPARILLVEDHEPTRTALTHLLVRRHYEVATAASLLEARALAGKQNFDVLISDIGLPDGSGYDLMTELREHHGLKGIALTGYGMEQDVARSQKSGFVAHLTKPVRMESLDNALAAIVDGKSNLISLKTLKTLKQ
ncbi:MAG TPA: ATP-binding protein [Verrucomicrobiae bacterium]|jgi:PAS domain S-box-containing protein